MAFKCRKKMASDSIQENLILDNKASPAEKAPKKTKKSPRLMARVYRLLAGILCACCSTKSSEDQDEVAYESLADYKERYCVSHSKSDMQIVESRMDIRQSLTMFAMSNPTRSSAVAVSRLDISATKLTNHFGVIGAVALYVTMYINPSFSAGLVSVIRPPNSSKICRQIKDELPCIQSIKQIDIAIATRSRVRAIMDVRASRVAFRGSVMFTVKDHTRSMAVAVSNLDLSAATMENPFGIIGAATSHIVMYTSLSFVAIMIPVRNPTTDNRSSETNDTKACCRIDVEIYPSPIRGLPIIKSPAPDMRGDSIAILSQYDADELPEKSSLVISNLAESFAIHSLTESLARRPKPFMSISTLAEPSAIESSLVISTVVEPSGIETSLVISSLAVSLESCCSFNFYSSPTFSNDAAALLYNIDDEQLDNTNPAAFPTSSFGSFLSLSAGGYCAASPAVSSYLSAGEYCGGMSRGDHANPAASFGSYLSPGEFCGEVSSGCVFSNGEPVGFDLDPSYYQDAAGDDNDSDTCSVFSLDLGDDRQQMYAFDMKPREGAFQFPKNQTDDTLNASEYVDEQSSPMTPQLSINVRNNQHNQCRYLAMHTYTRPRFCLQRQAKLSQAKTKWGAKRQGVFQHLRQKRREHLETKNRLKLIQLAGPGVIPSCGQHELGCDIINSSDIRPVMNPDSGAPVILGQGISGRVELIRHVPSGYLMASKTIFAETPERAQKDMAQEIRALSAVRGEEAFPTLIGVINQQHFVTFALEYIGDWITCKSYTLVSQLTHQTTSREDWLQIASDIGKGLKTLHGKGYIHCDLHANNVLILQQTDSLRPRAKIIDLGQATPRDITGIRYLDLSDPQKELAYKRHSHLAPELIEGESFYTVQSDVYAFGRILKMVSSHQLLGDLMPISEAAMCRNPMDRWSIGHVLREIDNILQVGTGFW